MKKLKDIVKNTKRKIEEWRKRYELVSKNLKETRKNNANDKRELKELKKRVPGVRNDIVKAEKAGDKERSKTLNERLVVLVTRIETLEKRIKARKAVVRDRVKRKRHFKKRLRFFIVKHTKARKKYKAAKEDAKNGNKPKFESYMLNGCPNTLSDDEKEALAYVVVVHDQVCTATSNGGHSTTSYHYYSPCRAFDAAGVYYKMQEAQRGLRAKYGNAFRELFGPDAWYLKNGVEYSGVFPAHHDHIHVTRNF